MSGNSSSKGPNSDKTSASVFVRPTGSVAGCERFPRCFFVIADFFSLAHSQPKQCAAYRQSTARRGSDSNWPPCSSHFPVMVGLARWYPVQAFRRALRGRVGTRWGGVGVLQSSPLVVMPGLAGRWYPVSPAQAFAPRCRCPEGFAHRDGRLVGTKVGRCRRPPASSPLVVMPGLVPGIHWTGIIGIDLAKRSFQFARGAGGRLGRVPPLSRGRFCPFGWRRARARITIDHALVR